LLDEAYEYFGVLPTLLERDFNIPPFDELMKEVKQISEYQNNHEKISALETQHVTA
jgi:hypothetical protein